MGRVCRTLFFAFLATAQEVFSRGVGVSLGGGIDPGQFYNFGVAIILSPDAVCAIIDDFGIFNLLCGSVPDAVSGYVAYYRT